MLSRIPRFIAPLVSASAIAIFLYRSLPYLGGLEGKFSLATAFHISLFVIAVQLVNALKLRTLLPEREPVWRLFGICLLSNLFGAILSTQIAGDLSKLWILKRNVTPSAGKGMAVVRDRLSSCAAVGIVLFCGLAAKIWPDSISPLGHLFVFAFAVWGCALLSSRLELVVGGAIGPLLKRLGVRSLVVGQAESATARQWLFVHGASLSVQLIGVGTVWYSFHMLGAEMGVYETVMLSSISAISVVLPLAVGGMGVREISAYSLLLYWGYSQPLAAAGIAQLTAGYLIGTGLGALLGLVLTERRKGNRAVGQEERAYLPLS